VYSTATCESGLVHQQFRQPTKLYPNQDVELPRHGHSQATIIDSGQWLDMVVRQDVPGFQLSFNLPNSD
jgi:hypothetical protein